MRREGLPRKRVQRREDGYLAGGLAGERPVEEPQRLSQRLGLLVRFHQQKDGPAQHRCAVRDDEGLGRLSEAGQPCLPAAAAQLVQNLLDGGVAPHPSEKLSDRGKNHSRGPPCGPPWHWGFRPRLRSELRIRSRMPVVE